MSANNGIIRIGKKGMKKFAFGDEGEPFDVDVVVAFQQWITIDEGFRQSDVDGMGTIRTEDMAAYHRAAVEFAQGLANQPAQVLGKSPGQDTYITTAEALDFIARLREQYDELADFFQPRRRTREESPDTSEGGLQFSVEEGAPPTSTR